MMQNDGYPFLAGICRRDTAEALELMRHLAPEELWTQMVEVLRWAVRHGSPGEVFALLRALEASPHKIYTPDFVRFAFFVTDRLYGAIP